MVEKVRKRGKERERVTDIIQENIIKKRSKKKQKEKSFRKLSA